MQHAPCPHNSIDKAWESPRHLGVREPSSHLGSVVANRTAGHAATRQPKESTILMENGCAHVSRETFASRVGRARGKS